jgi:hypothetical protein
MKGCSLRSSALLLKLSLCTLRSVLVIKLGVSLAFKDSYTEWRSRAKMCFYCHQVPMSGC